MLINHLLTPHLGFVCNKTNEDGSKYLTEVKFAAEISPEHSKKVIISLLSGMGLTFDERFSDATMANPDLKLKAVIKNSIPHAKTAIEIYNYKGTTRLRLAFSILSTRPINSASIGQFNEILSDALRILTTEAPILALSNPLSNGTNSRQINFSVKSEITTCSDFGRLLANAFRLEPSECEWNDISARAIRSVVPILFSVHSQVLPVMGTLAGRVPRFFGEHSDGTVAAIAPRMDATIAAPAPAEESLGSGTICAQRPR